MDKKPQMFTKVNGTDPVEYGFGPEWVAMAMYMDDFPRFYTEEDAIKYWNTVLKESEQ